MKNKIFVLVLSIVFIAMFMGSGLAQRSGAEIWGQTCGNCHMTQAPVRYTADQWKSIITHMKLYARLTDEEADAVMQFMEGGAKKISAAPVHIPENAVLNPVPVASASTASAIALSKTAEEKKTLKKR